MLSIKRRSSPLLGNSTRARALKITANARKDASAANSSSGALPFIDRRELLAGTLAGGASLVSSSPAQALPIGLPVLKRCQPSKVESSNVFCCPPEPKRDPIDFKFDTGPLRTRRPAQLVDEDYFQKYNKAYTKMRALPPDDPRSFRQQANVHCAYCDFAYYQKGDPKSNLQIHFNWLFLPWHRWYLYFHEKILGSLIGDPTFALPFWNWDNQEGGSYIPEIFGREDSALYDVERNPDHYAPTRVNLFDARLVNPDFNPDGNKSLNYTDDEIIKANISIMHNSVAKVKSKSAFFGVPLRYGQGEIAGGDGSVERAPHSAVHIFGGKPTNPHREDLGNFYSAGRDPLFYSHHANVDRMWNVWKSLEGNKDITEPDFLNAEFYFFDQNQDLVRCNIKDSFDSEKAFKYNYESMPQDKVWINYKPVPLAKKGSPPLVPEDYPLVKNGEAVTVKGSPVTFAVEQPKGSGVDELLVLEDLELTMQITTNFNVYINLPTADEGTTPDCAEFIGSLYNIPHFMPAMATGSRKTFPRFSIKENIEILGLKNASKLVVTIVPRGIDKDKPFSFKGATIEYAEADSL